MGRRGHRIGPTALLALAASALTLVLAAPEALATHVQCGAVITTDTTLDEDLHCAGDGILVGADGVTLNLNGHTITGPGANGPGFAAVSDFGDHDGIGVENGAITDYVRGFDPGSTNRETSGHHISNVAVARTFVAVSLFWTRGVRIEDNVFTEFQQAMFVSGPSNLAGQQGVDETLIRGNSFAGPGIAIFPFSSGNDDNVIEQNRFDQTAGGGILGGRNRILRNTFVGVSGGFGASGTGNIAQRNRIQGDGATGLSFEGSDTLVADNAVTGFSIGISVKGARPRIQRNSVVVSVTGIALADTVDAVLTRNRVRNTLGDGIQIPASASGTLVFHNRVSGSDSDDGIDVDSVSTTLTRNEAHDNADLGIEAVAGVTDGGGNRARRNGNSLECTGVQCR